jgi:hypothetical protein
MWTEFSDSNENRAAKSDLIESLFIAIKNFMADDWEKSSVKSLAKNLKFHEILFCYNNIQAKLLQHIHYPPVYPIPYQFLKELFNDSTVH